MIYNFNLMKQEVKPKRPPCPNCSSSRILKNGSTHHKKPKYLCKECGRQFIENPRKRYVTNQEKDYIKRSLLERNSLRGIARVFQVSIKWLQRFTNDFYRSIPLSVSIIPHKTKGLILECDELWSFVGSKENEVYLWLALDRETRQVVGFHLGRRRRKDAEKLWSSLPEVYKEEAEVYTDFWQSYEKVIPEERHHPSGKESGETSHIERFNNTLRQRCSRLVRKGLSFSKNLFNHKGAIAYFLNDYNEQLRLT